jgi:O-antigen/teichoic acid export membrane protein
MNQFVLIGSFGMAIFAAIIGWFFESYFQSEAIVTFWLALLLLPLLGLNRLRSSSLRGLRHIVLSQIPEMILRPLLFMILIGVFYLFYGDRFKAPCAMSLQVITTTIVFFFSAWLLSLRLPQNVKDARSSYDTKNWLTSLLPFLVIGGIGIVNERTDILMLGALKGVKSVGVYQVVLRGANLIPFFLYSVNDVLAPNISKLYIDNDMSSLQNIITTSARIVFLFTLPVAFVMIFFGKWLITLFFGAEFAYGALPLSILSAAHLITVSMGCTIILLNMTYNERETLKVFIIAASLNIILNAILIPNFGINGAAIATSVSFVFLNLISVIKVIKKIGIHTTVFGKLIL